MSEELSPYGKPTWYRDKDGKLRRCTDNGPLEIEYKTTDFGTILQLKQQYDATCFCRLEVNSSGLMLFVQGRREDGGRMMKKISCIWDQ